MYYVLLTISMFSMVLQNNLFNSVSKKSLRDKYDTFYYNSILYLVCFVLFAVLSVKTGFSTYSVLLGLLFGIVTMFCNFFKLAALSKGPMHITILVTTSSMIIPTLSGAVLFNETFSIGKLLATFLLIGFIYVSMAKDKSTGFNKLWVVYCILAFLFQGIIGILQKVHQTSVHKDELFVFLAISFLFSFLFSGTIALCGKRGKRDFPLKKKEYAFALISGICTFTMNFLNLKLSGILPTQLFFPLVNGGAIVFSSITSIVIFKEKLSRRQVVGLIGGLLSLILICIL